MEESEEWEVDAGATKGFLSTKCEQLNECNWLLISSGKGIVIAPQPISMESQSEALTGKKEQESRQFKYLSIQLEGGGSGDLRFYSQITSLTDS